MNDPTIDVYGRPTEETLAEIAGWPKERGWRELLRFVRAAWTPLGQGGGSLEAFPLVDGREVWIAVPNGCKGNVSLLAALRENADFWDECAAWAAGGPAAPCAFQLWPPVAPCGDHRYCDTCLNRGDCGRQEEASDE